jgi:hypothetical protein
MRIWDIDCKNLCDKHLVGEHRELHAIWSILTTEKGGSYKNHPETLRWKNRLGLLSERHLEQAWEMKNRGWKHNSFLKLENKKWVYGEKDKLYWQTVEEQINILKNKGCNCKI